MFLPYQLSPCEGSRVESPFYEEWLYSPHNDYTKTKPSVHWDNDDPSAIARADYAKCHSTLGARWHSLNTGNETDNEFRLGTTIECVACHNDVTLTKESVEFPSGVTIEHLGDESRCMECHQGRESGPDVAAEIEEAGLTEDVDTVSGRS